MLWSLGIEDSIVFSTWKRVLFGAVKQNNLCFRSVCNESKLIKKSAGSSDASFNVVEVFQPVSFNVYILLPSGCGTETTDGRTVRSGSQPKIDSG